MQIDSIVLVVVIVGLIGLGLAAAFFSISPEGIAIINHIINILAVILGGAGYARVLRFARGQGHG